MVSLLLTRDNLCNFSDFTPKSDLIMSIIVRASTNAILIIWCRRWRGGYFYSLIGSADSSLYRRGCEQQVLWGV